MKWNQNQNDVKAQIRDFWQTNYQAEFINKDAKSDEIRKATETNNGKLHIVWHGGFSSYGGFTKRFYSASQEWDFYFDLDEEGNAYNPKTACTEHKVYADKVCPSCKKVLCSKCRTLQYVDYFPKKEEMVCAECFKEKVNAKIRGLTIALILGVILGIAFMVGGGPLLFVVGFLMPYMARISRSILGGKGSASEFIFFLAVLFGSATMIFPLYHLVMEIRLRLAQKKTMETL